MRKVLFSVLMASIAVCTLCAGVSHATVINFNDLVIAGDGYTFMPSYSNSGFTLTSDHSSPYAFVSPQQGNGWYFGSANLYNNYSFGWTTLTSSGAFTINSIDLHGLYSSGAPLDFYAYSESTPVGYLHYVIPDYDWNTVNFGSSFENITSLKWQQTYYPYHCFDNIVLTAVPEPATMVLFGIGSAAMAFARRKKKLA